MSNHPAGMMIPKLSWNSQFYVLRFQSAAEYHAINEFGRDILFVFTSQSAASNYVHWINANDDDPEPQFFAYLCTHSEFVGLIQSQSELRGVVSVDAKDDFCPLMEPENVLRLMGINVN